MNKKIILVVKQVGGDPDNVVSTYYKSVKKYKELTDGDKIIKQATISIENKSVYKHILNDLANWEIDIENWIDYELEQNTTNEDTHNTPFKSVWSTRVLKTHYVITPTGKRVQIGHKKAIQLGLIKE